MRYVLGLVTSSNDTRSGESPELDFVRLTLAARTMADAGCTAHGYLVALDERAAARARIWQRKYAARDLVTVLLQDAKAGEQVRPHAVERSDAIAGEALRAAVREHEPGVVEAAPGVAVPFDVRWSYFGTLGDDNALGEHEESFGPRS